MSFDIDTIPRLIAKLRRPPFNKSTQEIGDLTARQLADIFAKDEDEAASSGGHNIDDLLKGQGVDDLPPQLRSSLFK